MSERDDYPAGVPCWVTNLAPDVREAMDFYGELFGWSFGYDADGDFAVARLRDRDVAGIGQLSEAGPGVEAAWVTNVRVDSADAAAQQGPAAGGRLLAGPLDFPPAGRLTVLADPAGAVVCTWEAATRKGAQVVNEPGAWAMSGLRTPDPAGATAFYAALFGWEAEALGDATMFRRPGYVGGEPEQPVPRDVVAAMGPPTQGPAAWIPDFWIADAEAAAATAARTGGRVTGDLEDMGPFRRATLADPGGAAFTVSQLVLGRVG